MMAISNFNLSTTMIFSLHVIDGPYSKQSNLSALRFCEAALIKGHRIKRVFFSGDGVLSGTDLAVTPQDEVDLYKAWQSVATDHQIELVVCVSACLRRGVLNVTEAERYEKQNHNLSDAFVLSGLGQLVEAGLESDRLITFGG